MKHDNISVAIVGNPNVGKSTVFNTLTGARQDVGNWCGQTTKVCSSIVPYNGGSVTFHDLPGVYGLGGYTDEEMTVNAFLRQSPPDVILLMISAAEMERNLYVAIEALERFGRLIVLVNKTDIAQQKGLSVDTEKMSELLGVRVLEAAAGPALREEILELVCQVAREAERPVHQTVYPEQVEAAIKAHREETGRSRSEILQLLAAENEQLQLEIISARHHAAQAIAETCIRRAAAKGSWSDQIDSWALHPVFGVPIMLLLFGLLFYITFAVTRPLSEAIGEWFDTLGVLSHAILPGWGVPTVLVKLLADGILKGVGATLGFLPQMAFFFLQYNFIQDSGYISRIAFLTDRVMTAMGLNGKIFIPLVAGCTCNVNGILAARILSGKYDRTVAILASSYAPCSARLGVMVFLVSAFFTSTSATLVMLTLLGISVLLMAAVAYIVRWFIVDDAKGTFLLELPPYQIPEWRPLLAATGRRTLVFLHRIKNVVLISSVIMWYLSSYPAGPFNETHIARIGLMLEPFGKLMGMNWQLIVALILGFSAKETALGALGILFHASNEAGSLVTVLTAAIDPLAAFVFLLVYMIYTPCLTTIYTMYQETGSWRIAIFAIFGNLGFSIMLGIFAYHVGKLIFG